MNTNVARVKVPPAGRRVDQARVAVDNLAIAHFDQTNGTRARGVAIGGLKVDSGEVEGHA